MSKAKELATKLRDLIKNSNHIVSDGADIMSWDWYDFDPLIKAVLSEPEPELRGWIEVTGRDGNKKLINLALVERVDVDTKSGVYLEFNRDDCVAYVKESYDSIKQKIRGGIVRIDNTIGPYDRIDRLNGIIKDQKSRIAELEAEVERLKPQDEMTYPEALKALQEMADFIKQQSATDFEEGEG